MPEITNPDPAQFWLIAISLAILLGLTAVAYWQYKRLYRKAADAQARCRESIENLGEGFYRATTDGQITYVNRALARMQGFESPDDLVAEIRDSVTELYLDPARVQEFRRLLNKNGSVENFISRIRCLGTGGTMWISENARVIRDPETGQPQYYEGSLRDVSEQIERREFERKMEKLATNLPGGLFQMVRHADGRFSVPYLSSGFIRMFGLEETADRVDPLDYFPSIHPEDQAEYLNGMIDSARNLRQWSCEFRYIGDGTENIWMHVTATPERLEDGSTVWHGHVSDISQRKRAETQVRRLADFDSLTDLPNRRVFTRKLEEAIQTSLASGAHAAVFFIDLDNFKTLNDTHGHELGDELLRQVADRLRASIRDTDTVGRFGGDEFVLLIRDLSRDEDKAINSALGMANKVLSEIEKSFDLAETHHVTSASIGAVVFDGSGTHASQVIKCADIAMYEAKRSGRNRYVLFDPAKFHDVSAGYELQGQLRGAMANSEFFFEFQPIVNSAGAVFGCEALLRWNHPERGRLSPGEFIPIAENTGMIHEINDWVLREAINTLRNWQKIPAMRRMHLSVNISVQQFNSDSFVPLLVAAIEREGIDASLLTLELTEHMMARNPDQVAARMRELKQTGVRISLDDFGTGYSSLSQLNRFPFDEVKIDGAFVAEIENSRSNRSLIEAILGMTAALGLDTVAEHVGSPFQVAFLKERGCERFQGYFYHAPLSHGELVEMMNAGSSSSKPALTLVK